MGLHKTCTGWELNLWSLDCQSNMLLCYNLATTMWKNIKTDVEHSLYDSLAKYYSIMTCPLWGQVIENLIFLIIVADDVCCHPDSPQTRDWWTDWSGAKVRWRKEETRSWLLLDCLQQDLYKFYILLICIAITLQIYSSSKDSVQHALLQSDQSLWWPQNIRV